MKIAVDVTSLLDPPTGVSVVARHYIRGLAAEPGTDLLGFAASWRGRDRLGDLESDLGIRIGRRPMAAQPLRQAWMRADWPPVEWWTGACDVVWGPNFVVPPSKRAAGLATIHDLTCVRFPEMVTADVAQYPALIRRAVRRGAHVHAVSEYVAGEVVDAFGIPRERVHVVPNGVDPGEVMGGDAARGRRLAARERYVLSVATLEPRKDLTTLVRAFDTAAASDADLALVLTGRDGWGAAEVHAAIAAATHRDRIVRTGFVDDAARRDLLAGAAVLAYPSRYEGFGLPPLEAMAAGVPVVATATGALPEVCGDAALLVPVGDVDALAGALAQVVTDAEVRDGLLARGAARVGAYTWPASVTSMHELLTALSDPSG
jgi:glycosyltransferase involved in cell wall biosynthesis